MNTKPQDRRILIMDAAYDDTMSQAVARVFAEFPFAWRGKKVLVKPNLLSPHAPEAGVTTHPTLIRAVVRELKARGASPMVGDNPGVGGYGQSEPVARKCGAFAAAEGTFIHLGRAPVRQRLKSRILDYVMLSQDVLDADLVVNLPKLKTHSLTCISGAVKNTFGYVVGGDKMRVHAAAGTSRQFAEALVDIYQVRPPELNIMDAVEAMEGNGPSHGTLIKIGKVLAGTNAVGLDTAVLHLIGRPTADVQHLKIAGRRGLGETDYSRLEVSGSFTPVASFKLPATVIPGLAGMLLNRLVANWINCVPEVDAARCKNCGICVEHCPVGAMLKFESHPRADEKKCISCYCCQELCPQDAIKLSGRILNFVRRSYVPK